MKIINSYYQLGSAFYKKQQPALIKNPRLLIFNQKLAKKFNFFSHHNSQKLANIFCGNQLLKNSQTISLAYAGHQFGHFVATLGDGRAVLLGEVKDKNKNLFDIQLKGSGRTFFSRNGDGKCPLDAAIREYIVSEAMHFLKIPSTRSLAIVQGDEIIQRENFLPASVITRVAKSHLRIGTFEYFSYKNDWKNLKILTDYTIKRHYLKLQNKKNPYLSLLKIVMQKQAQLVSLWMSIGFIHGVMNTDNTTISGQSIDFGPCAFMDIYEKNKRFSFIDKHGRYSFDNQKNIIWWNLIRFAETLIPLIHTNKQKSILLVEKQLETFPKIFDKIYFPKMATKLGIFDFQDSDKNLVIEFLDILEKNHIDWTNGFRILSKVLLKEKDFYNKDVRYFKWHNKWLKRIKQQNLALIKIVKRMDKINPILIPRNHIIARIIKNCVFTNDWNEFHNFLKIIETPFIEKSSYQQYYLPPTQKEEVLHTFCGT